MNAEEIKQQLEKRCLIKIKKKIFNKEEIKALHLMIDVNNFSQSKASEFFKTSTVRIKKIINLILKNKPKCEEDYENICKAVNT